MTDTSKIWLTPEDIANELGFHVETIRRYLRKGMIKSIKMGKGRKAKWLVHKTDFDQWVQSLTYSLL